MSVNFHLAQFEPHYDDCLLISVIGALLKFKFSKRKLTSLLKDKTGLKFKIDVSTLYLIGSYAQKLVASLIIKKGEIIQCLQNMET